MPPWFIRKKERRQSKRYYYPPNKGPFAVEGPTAGRLGQIADISLGGLAFYYLYDGEEWSNLGIKLSMVLNLERDEDIEMSLETVSDRLVQKNYHSSGSSLRRRSVRFAELSPSAGDALAAYIDLQFQ
ncbi:MAG: PilZ domain-containing protein [Proteobacteria bacterium]|nr:PilZ domain-containing protein [Pseudomonadota bacterium]MBU1688151.1 PilZ domain-containing protein [Pseudomonadota bacterium]